MSCLVVCFCELDDDLLTIPGVGNKNRLTAVRVQTRVYLVAELNILPSFFLGKAGDVREESCFGDGLEIQLAIKLF